MYLALAFAWGSALLAFPACSQAQETGDGCTFCEPCLNPDYPKTDPFEITMYAIRVEFEMHCEFDYSCMELQQGAPCQPTEDEQAELIALVDRSDGEGIRALAKKRPRLVELVPERNLVLFRSACRDEVIGVYPFPSS